MPIYAEVYQWKGYRCFKTIEIELKWLKNPWIEPKKAKFHAGKPNKKYNVNNNNIKTKRKQPGLRQKTKNHSKTNKLA